MAKFAILLCLLVPLYAGPIQDDEDLFAIARLAPPETPRANAGEENASLQFQAEGTRPVEAKAPAQPVYPSWPSLLLVAIALATMPLAWRGERWEQPQPAGRIRYVTSRR